MKILSRFTSALILEIETLRDADLSDADLSVADLSGADLSGADLSGADLRDADLSDADLSVADLSVADLSGADLSGADLRDADLSVADLRGADLSGADLRGAKNIACAGPLGSRGDFLFANSGHDTDDCLMWKAGCRWCNTAELYEAIAKTHGDGQYAIEYRAAMAFIMVRLGVKEPAGAE